MDFTNVEVVKDCIAVSQNIADYFSEERYLAEVEQPEELNPNVVSVMAVNLLLEELGQMGICTNQEAEDLVIYPKELESMYAMRTVFDKDNFRRILLDMSENKFSEFCAVIEECGVPGDFLPEIAEFLEASFPNDERYQDIRSSAEHWWWSSDPFAAHINTILTQVRLHEDHNHAVVADDNVDDVALFLKMFQERDVKIALFVKKALEVCPELDKPILQALQTRYDRDKLHPDMLPLFARYAAHRDWYNTEPLFMKNHHRKTLHHVEYWKAPENRTKVPTKEQLAMLVFSLALDGLSASEMDEQLSFLASRLDKSSSDLMGRLVRIPYTEFVGGETA